MRASVPILILALLAAACGGDSPLEPVGSTATSAAAAATTTTPPTTTTIPPAATSTTTSTVPATTTTVPATTTTVPATTTTLDPVVACLVFAADLGELLGATSDQLLTGAAVTSGLTDGTVSDSEGAVQLVTVADGFETLMADLESLGPAPAPMADAAALVSDALDLFARAYRRMAQGASQDDQDLIDEGVLLLDQGADLLGEVGPALQSCDPGDAGGDILITPSETDVEVYLRTGEILLADTPYADMDDEVLISGAKAACRGLAEQGVETAIAEAIAVTPAAGAPFLADEHSLALFLLTRGVPKWCPDLVEDEEAFADEVVSTIVDMFLED